MKNAMIKKVICSVKRGGLEESRHEINCIVINQEHKIIFQSGEVNKDYCLRSTLKPFQCAASLDKDTDIKYNLSQKEIAITCASHHGEEEHINAVRSILKKISLTEENLECGFHFPINKQNKTKLYSKEVKQSNIYNNCSGKHSGLLALIKNLGLPIKGYINHKHPIHQYINNYIEKIIQVKTKQFAVDGCSLPTPYFSLFSLANMYMELISAPNKTALNKVFSAMTKYPQMVSGTKGFDTYFMKTFNGRAVAKGGAEGMQALAIKIGEKEYVSLVLKVSDGSHRGNYISCIRILNYLNILKKEEHTRLLEFVMAKQYNLNKIKTGELVCNILD